MTRSQEIIEAHQNCIELIECIENYKRYITTNEENIKVYSRMMFGNLVKDLKHDIQIQKMVVKRLEERYKSNYTKIVSFF